MKKYITPILLAHILYLLCSCSNSSELEPAMPNISNQNDTMDMTLFMYMPWCDLTAEQQHNLDDMQEALSHEKLPGKRVMAFISISASEAHLIELTGGNKKIIKTYSNPHLTTSQGIASIISDVKQKAPANHYAMTIGCHGSGWLPIGSLDQSRHTINNHTYNYFDSYHPTTRYFGGVATTWQTDIPTLVEALKLSETHLDYLIFDACYMGCVEVAYELREVTDISVLSPSEIMGIGIPYKAIGTLLLQKSIDWQLICSRFYEFFSSYAYPYGTLSVIDSKRLTLLATEMKQLNDTYNWSASRTSELQTFGGFYGEDIFFDLGHYAETLSNGNCNKFIEALKQAVIVSSHTKRCYVARYGTLPINHYSGLSCSDPSDSPITISWPNTQWAMDTK